MESPPTSLPARIRDGNLFIALSPALFVLLWSTGFLGMKMGVQHAGTMTLLATRFALTTAVLLVICAFVRPSWPKSPTVIGHAVVVGILLHVVYIGGVGQAVGNGISTAVVALVAGLQPLITAAFVGRLLGEAVSRLQWLGLALGFTGVGLVVFAKISIGEATVAGFGFTVMCLAGITAGTLYQKKFCQGHDMLSGMMIQFITAVILTSAIAWSVEGMRIEWTGEFVFAVVWLGIITSIGAFALLFWLLRRGEAARVTSLFYLTPPTTAVMGYALFGETLGWLALLGMAVAVIGVALVNR